MNERIKTIRKNANLNQTEFADRIGASRDKIASYETGRVVPPDTVLKLICREFGIREEWLKTGAEPMEDPAVRLTNTYQSLPDRLKGLVDALAEMDENWYQTLDNAFAEIERRKKEGCAH